jgi:hypothetical protein
VRAHPTILVQGPTPFRTRYDVGEVWNGAHPEDGSELIVEDGIPGGFPPPDLDAEPQLTAPGVDAAFLAEAAARLFR